MESRHVCQSCGAVLVVHNHSSYREVRTCLHGVYESLARECASWPSPKTARLPLLVGRSEYLTTMSKREKERNEVWPLR
jgi:hypothetical protein